MLDSVHKRIMPIFWPVLMGIMLSIGILLPILFVLSLDGMGAAIFVCIFVTIFVAGCKQIIQNQWILTIAYAVFFCLFYMITGVFGHLNGIINAFAHLFNGNLEPIHMYANQIAILLGSIIAVFSFNAARHTGGFYPAITMLMSVFMLFWFSGYRRNLWLFVPGLIVICALFARTTNEKTPQSRVMIVSFLAVAMALGVTQLFTITSHRMEKFADQLRNLIVDTLFFTEPRTVYSLQVDGYMPLNSRLGGPVDIIDRPVMMVETPRKVYLRGTISNNYTGLSWNDTLSTRRYLYSDPRHRGTRADTMDEKRPDAKFQKGTMFDTMQVNVTMQSTSASTLFAPLRMKDLSTPIELVPYFNTSSEMFVTRDLQVGDTYSFAVSDIYPYSADLPEVLSNTAMEGERRDMSDYLHLPDVISQDVYTLTQSIVAGKIAPLDKARAIQTYLLETYSYTLQPAIPPYNYDFVSFFLLRGKEGYCTYFATAMAVMGRIAGLPTRYVEGYVAHPSGGIALVTSKQAHSWAEVYFDGFGWVTFDATPGETYGGNQNDDDQNAQNQENDQENNEQTQEEQQNEEDQTDSPPETDVQGGESDTNDTGDNDQDTQQEQDDPNDADDQTSDNTENADSSARKRGGSGLLWLLVLLFVAAIAVRWLWTRIETITIVHCRNDKERLMVWYKSILCLVAIAGYDMKPYETPIAHVMRIESFLPKDCKLQEVADAVTHVGYGRFGAASPAQIIEAKGCYKAIWRGVPLKVKALWFIQRMRYGIGNVRQVP